MRIGAHATAVHADELEQLAGANERIAASDALVRAHHVDELVADAHDRVERVHGALEDHRDVAPAELAQLLRALPRRGPRPGRGCCRRRCSAGGAEDLHDRVRDACSCRIRTRPRARGSPRRRSRRSTPSTRDARARTRRESRSDLEQRLRRAGRSTTLIARQPVRVNRPARRLRRAPFSMRRRGLLTSSMPASISTRPSDRQRRARGPGRRTATTRPAARSS